MEISRKKYFFNREFFFLLRQMDEISHVKRQLCAMSILEMRAKKREPFHLDLIKDLQMCHTSALDVNVEKI